MGSACSPCRGGSRKQKHSARSNGDAKNDESSTGCSSQVDNASDQGNKTETPSEASPSSEKGEKSEKFDKNQQPERNSLEKTNKRCSEDETPHIERIEWEGFEPLEPTGATCLVCEIDLAYEPNAEQAHHDDSGGGYVALTLLPEVAVLACGHAFHDKCLLSVTSENQSMDPPCFLCDKQVRPQFSGLQFSIHCSSL